MAWCDVVNSLPGAMRSLLSPSVITLPDRDGKRVIYASKPGAVVINFRFQSMLLLMGLVRRLLDSDTFELEIATPMADETIEGSAQVWDNVMTIFPGASFVGYEKEVQDA